jgi:hypothetical protein
MESPMGACQMCGTAVTWRAASHFYECSGCVRRWLSWPPEFPVLIMGWKGMQWNGELQRAVPWRTT